MCTCFFLNKNGKKFDIEWLLMMLKFYILEPMSDENKLYEMFRWFTRNELLLVRDGSSEHHMIKDDFLLVMETRGVHRSDLCLTRIRLTRLGGQNFNPPPTKVIDRIGWIQPSTDGGQSGQNWRSKNWPKSNKLTAKIGNIFVGFGEISLDSVRSRQIRWRFHGSSWDLAGNG